MRTVAPAARAALATLITAVLMFVMMWSFGDPPFVKSVLRSTLAILVASITCGIAVFVMLRRSSSSS